MTSESLPVPSLSLIAFVEYNEPLVYGWRRKEKYLYIGMTSIGTKRPFYKNHHIINKFDSWQYGDAIDIWFTSNPRALEKSLINKLNPPYNKSKYSLEKICIRCNKKFFTKEQFAVCYPCLNFYRTKDKHRFNDFYPKPTDIKYQRYLNGEQ